MFNSVSVPFFQNLAKLTLLLNSLPTTYISLPNTYTEVATALNCPLVRGEATPFFQSLATVTIAGVNS